MPNTLFPRATAETKARLELDEAVRLTNSFDWAASELGPIAGWPEALKSAVRLMLVAEVPMVMLAGKREGRLIYNRGYAEFARDRHPGIFGQPVLEAWPEIADFNRGNMERGFAGESWYLADQELVLDRSGGLEPAYLNLNYSPVLDDDGTTLAVIVIVIETTPRVLAERALAQSREKLDLALSASGIVGTWDWAVDEDRVTADARFAEMFGLDPADAAAGVPVSRFTANIHEDDRQRVTEEIETAVREGGGARFEYRVRHPDGTDHHVVASGQVIQGPTGKRFPGVIVDITDEKKAAAALNESEMRFRILADTMPQMVWSTLPDGFHDYYNARWYEFTGAPEGSTDGEGWNDMFHPDDQERAWDIWRHSLETGEPYHIEYRLRHHTGLYRWVLGRALPIRNAAGRITRWIGTCTDIHEAKLAAEEREIVAQELSHRIKNIFSVITGIVALTARSHPELKALGDDLRGRIYALGRAHDFVRPHAKSLSARPSPKTLHNLITELLSPYRVDGEERLRFTGDDIPIDDASATPLALLFHELATNAAKYGALSVPEGYVEIHTAVNDAGCTISWQEVGGPPTDPSDKEGFGSKLMTLSVAGQLQGKLDRQWRPEGMRVEVTLPDGVLSRSGRLRPEQSPSSAS